eukprot:jgi/Mesvir1/1445/Mv14436-RA.1
MTHAWSFQPIKMSSLLASTSNYATIRAVSRVRISTQCRSPYPRVAGCPRIACAAKDNFSAFTKTVSRRPHSAISIRGRQRRLPTRFLEPTRAADTDSEGDSSAGIERPDNGAGRADETTNADRNQGDYARAAEPPPDRVSATISALDGLLGLKKSSSRDTRPDQPQMPEPTPKAEDVISALDRVLQTPTESDYVISSEDPDKRTDVAATDKQGPEGGAPPGAPGSDPRPSVPNGVLVPLVSPKLSYYLVGANLFVYGVGVALAWTLGNDTSNEFFLAAAAIKPNIVAGEYYRVFTSIFLHAGLLHLGANTLALLSVGPEAEAVLGYRTFGVVYLFSGLGGSIISFLLTDNTSVGASGALFGLVGALVAYFLRNPSLFRSRLQLAYLVGILLLNFWLSSDPDSYINTTGHVAGLLSGLFLGWYMVPRFVLDPRVVRRNKFGTTPSSKPKGQNEEEMLQQMREKAGILDMTPQSQRVTIAATFGLSLLILFFSGVQVEAELQQMGLSKW